MTVFSRALAGIFCLIMAAGFAEANVNDASSTLASESSPGARGAKLSGATLTVESILEAIDAREKTLKDISLRFEQKTVIKGTGDAQTTTGRVILSRSPERFLVNFESPVENAASYDGKELLLYFPDTEQAFKQRASLEDIGKIIGISPISPMKHLGERYKAEIARCTKGFCEIAFREGPSKDIRWRIIVDPGEWLVKGAVLENEDIRIELKWFDFKVNRGFKTADFRIKLPAGVVVEEGGQMFPFSGGL